MLRHVTLGTDCTGIDAAYYALKGCLSNNTRMQYMFASDIQPKIRDLLRHTTKPKHIYDDVSDRNVADMPSVDIYIAGFPYQTFSNLGKRTGIHRPKGTNLLSFVK